MLKREPNSKMMRHEDLWSEIHLLDRMQMNLAKQQGVATSLQKLVAKAKHLSEANSIASAVVFLTEKKRSPAIDKVLEWLGMGNDVDEETIFAGKVTGTFGPNDQLQFQMQLYHFDHYPARILPDCYSALNIVVYDPDFRSEYPDLELAEQVLGLDPSVCVLIDLSDAKREITAENTPKIRSILKKYIKVGQLRGSVRDALVNEELVRGVQTARLLNHLRFMDFVHRSLTEDLEDKEKKWQGKAMLTFKKELQLQNTSADRSGREMAQLKLRINGGYKQLIGFVEGKTDTLDKIAPEYRQLEEEITSFLGFVENKSSRYLTLKIAEGAVKDKMQKANALLSDFFDDLLKTVNEGIASVEGDIRELFHHWQLDPPEIDIPLLDDRFTNTILVGNNPLPDKTYEKQIISKGFGSLLMELRTPLFMLMPFMMIFALFASLVGEADKGNVDETVMFHENRPAIAVNRLPESRDNEFGRFISDLERYNAPGKGVFEKGIKGELATEPQLAVKNIEVPQNYGNGTKTEQQLDYFFHSKDQMVYLYLNPTGDRNFVIDKLYDPGLELLTIPASTRRGFGIGGLIRFLSGLRDYRYIIFIGLLTLILWFVITRKRSMDAELAAAKNKERFKLNSDLRMQIDKMVKLNVQKWRSKLTDELGSRENTLLKMAERTLNHNVDSKRQQMALEKKTLQKRTASLKAEKSKLTNLRSEIRKLRTKYDQLENKIKRTLR